MSLAISSQAGTMGMDGIDATKDYYTGIQLDYSWQNIKGTNRQFFLNGNGATGSGSAPIKSNQGLYMGQFILGHTISGENLTLATEFGVGFYEGSTKKIYNAPSTVDQTIYSYVGEVSPQTSVLLSLLPGYKINSMTFYGRLGGGFTKYKTTETSIVDTNISPEVFSTVHSLVRWSPELILGLGLKKEFNNNLSMRLEYTYKKAQSFDIKTNDARSSTNPNVVRTSDNDYKVSSNNVGLAVLYNFDV